MALIFIIELFIFFYLSLNTPVFFQFYYFSSILVL